MLRRQDGPLAQRAAASILRDAQRFPALAQRDREDLLAAASRQRFDLAVFTNEMALKRQYLFYAGAADKHEISEFPIEPSSDNVILAASPLARPTVLSAALAAIARRYPPNSLDIVLIANSHGSDEMALIPRVNADLSRPDAQREMEQVLASDDNGVAPGLTRLQGIDKLEFWRVIGAVSAEFGARFPLVFREACASGLRSWREYGLVPASVGSIAHSAMGELDGEAINYARIFENADPSANWIAALAAGLVRDGVHVDAPGALWLPVTLIAIGSAPPFLFFLPLALWTLWLLISLRVKHRRRAAAKTPPLAAAFAGGSAPALDARE